MIFETREDIEAPIDAVFAMVSDFPSFERSAMRRGAEVTRTDSLGAPGVGMSWDIGFMMRGKKRDVQIELTSYDPPNQMVFTSTSASLGGAMELDLVALSRSRTRLQIKVALEPRNLSARLLVQSLKLAKGNLTNRFKRRVADFARDMEDRHKRIA